MANKISFKYFIGYKSDIGVVPLCIKLPPLSRYVKYFYGNKTMSFMVSDKKLLTKYNEILDKIINLLKKGFDSEPFYDNKYIKRELKMYNTKIYTNFEGNKIPEEGMHCACLSVILLDSVVMTDKKYHPQTFLKECKCAMKRMVGYEKDGYENNGCLIPLSLIYIIA